jgi:NCAIR mutase (PurE)-related protein
VRATPPLAGRVAVVSAGTSDQPVPEEAAVTASFFGAGVDSYFDVGVAGLHRLLGRAEEIRRAQVIVVVAGMEGALPSVVGGLVEAPVIAVPTSVGYGASFQGLAAPPGDAQLLCIRRGSREYRQRLRSGYLACSILRQVGRPSTT